MAGTGLFEVKLGGIRKGPKNPHDTPNSVYEFVGHPQNRGTIWVNGEQLEPGLFLKITGNLSFIEFEGEEPGDKVYWTWREK